MKTIFLDIDGTIFAQSDRCADLHNTQPILLKGSAKKCWEWHLKGYRIILTTGRPTTTRHDCELALAHHNIIYDQLIMDLGPFPRYLVNNKGHDNENKASAINVDTNKGIGHVELEEYESPNAKHWREKYEKLSDHKSQSV